MTTMKTIVLATCVLLILGIAGCSKAPSQEMTTAQTALSSAESVEADLYAPEAMAAARDSLEAAQAAIKAQEGKWAPLRRYGKSEKALASATAAAETARQQAEAGKAQARDDASTLIELARTDLDSVATMLTYAPAGKDNRADLELMKADVETMRTVLVDLQSLFDQERYLEARTKGKAIVEQLGRMRTELDAATAAGRTRKS